MLNIICLLGFVFSYVTFMKNECCDLVDEYAPKDAETLRKYFSDEQINGDKGYGTYIWGCIYTFVVLGAMSIPREMNSLRFSSVLGFTAQMYLATTIMILFLTDFDKELIPSVGDNLREMKMGKFEFSGLSGGFPIIIFAYSSQMNIPAIYREMETPNEKEFFVIYSVGTAICTLFYFMNGFFGYAIYA